MTTEPTNKPATPMTIDQALALWQRIHAESGTRIIAVIRLGESQGQGVTVRNAAEWEALRARLEGEGK